MSNPNRPKAVYVIKKIKKGGHAHHGGAWKIAYADFVTAMMAFFLLMWLMGSTTKGDLKGIADFFNNPLTVGFAGGGGSGDSSSLLNGGGTDLTRTVGQVKKGEVEGKRRGINLQALKADAARADAVKLGKLMAEIEKIRDTDTRLSKFRDRIRLDITKDGLRIQIVDDKNGPMFESGSSVVKGFMKDLLQTLGQVMNEVDNKITLSGHTDARPYGSGPNGYSNWELSADRANASRRELIAGGMSEEKIFRVVGLAASVPLNADDPMDPTNRRITIIVMNKDAEARMMRGGGQIEVEDAEGAAEAIRNAGDMPAPPPEAKMTALEKAVAAAAAAAAQSAAAGKTAPGGAAPASSPAAAPSGSPAASAPAGSAPAATSHAPVTSSAPAPTVLAQNSASPAPAVAPAAHAGSASLMKPASAPITR